MSVILVMKHLRRNISCQVCRKPITALPYLSNRHRNIKHYHPECCVKVNLVDEKVLARLKGVI